MPSVEVAVAAVLDTANRVLLVKENYGGRRYGFPGGLLDADETPQGAAIREALEETGVEVCIDYLVGVYRFETGLTSHVFRCSIVSGTPSLVDPREIAEVGWFRTDEIPAPVTSSVRHALADVVSGARGVDRDGLR